MVNGNRWHTFRFITFFLFSVPPEIAVALFVTYTVLIINYLSDIVQHILIISHNIVVVIDGRSVFVLPVVLFALKIVVWVFVLFLNDDYQTAARTHCVTYCSGPGKSICEHNRPGAAHRSYRSCAGISASHVPRLQC